MFQSVVCADRTSKSPKVGFDIVGIPIRVEASRGFKVRIVYKIGKRPSESSVKTNKQLWKRALHFVSLHQKCHDKRYCGYTIRMPFLMRRHLGSISHAFIELSFISQSGSKYGSMAFKGKVFTPKETSFFHMKSKGSLVSVHKNSLLINLLRV